MSHGIPSGGNDLGEVRNRVRRHLYAQTLQFLDAALQRDEPAEVGLGLEPLPDEQCTRVAIVVRVVAGSWLDDVGDPQRFGPLIRERDRTSQLRAEREEEAVGVDGILGEP